MTVPDIVVCLKVVPRPEEVSVDMETLTLDRSGRSLINPGDMYALEMALTLKDQYGGTVRLLSMGPPSFEQFLRVALAMGADEAYLLSDRAFGGADTLATSYALAAGVRKIGRYDLVICGEESSDGATAQVPPGIAEWLDLPQITYATDLKLVDSRWRVRATRAVHGGHEVLLSPLPALVSVRMRANEPRFIDMDRMDWARETPIEIWSAADLVVDESMIGLFGSATSVSSTRNAATRERRRELLTGTAAEQARALVERIRPYINGVRARGRAGGSSVDVRLPPGSAEGAEAGPAAAPRAARAVDGAYWPGDTPEVKAPEAKRAESLWSGRAELLDVNGNVIAELLADLWKDPAGRGHSRWGGMVCTELAHDHLPLEGVYALRLETGAVANVSEHGAVRVYLRGTLSGEEVEVHGMGEPPF